MNDLSHLAHVQPDKRFSCLEDQAVAAEAWETDKWAALSILDVEILTPQVIDPCCGTGVLSLAAREKGYSNVLAMDLYDWGYGDRHGVDWLDLAQDDLPGSYRDTEFSVFMNPPFSKACDFVDQAFALGARKVLCFQRQAWRESMDRRAWWEAHPPARTWTCGERAHTWLFHIPPEQRKNGRFMPSAWYVWERGHKGAEIGSAIWKTNP